ncbi:MAG: diacylglycerol kinase [Alphaproteobacteria bacterium]|nr:diacylglycerol kinase [Alphaproteobacteria bacterium]
MCIKKLSDELRRLRAACGYSADGLRWAWKQAAFRGEVALCAVLVPAGVWLGRTGVEKALLVGCLLLVLVVELLNCGLEAAIDRISLERHPLSKAAKDVGSAAVLISLLGVGLVWFFVLI